MIKNLKFAKQPLPPAMGNDLGLKPVFSHVDRKQEDHSKLEQLWLQCSATPVMLLGKDHLFLVENVAGSPRRWLGNMLDIFPNPPLPSPPLPSPPLPSPPLPSPLPSPPPSLRLHWAMKEDPWQTTSSYDWRPMTDHIELWQKTHDRPHWAMTEDLQTLLRKQAKQLTICLTLTFNLGLQ